MADSIGKLRIVVIHNPYDTFQEPLVKDLFSKMVELKLKGYRAEYPYGVLPVDASDFVAAHQMVCIESRSGFVPIMGYKSTTLEKCQIYNMVFPALNLVRQAGATPHDKAVEAIVANCKNPAELTYTGSWTVDPSVKRNPALATQLKHLFKTMYVLYHLENSIHQIIAGGTLRFKTEKLIERWGHEPLTYNGEKLPTIRVKHLLNEEVLVMHLKKFTEEAKVIDEESLALWQDRIVFGESVVQKDFSKKAA